MIQTFRMVRAAAIAGIAAFGIAAVVFALSGGGERSGLVEGGRASPVALQPGPQKLWPAWYESQSRREGVRVSGGGEPPAPLADAPAVPADGLRGLDPMAVLKADPRGRPLTRFPLIHSPGRPGIRPPVFHDLTGDGGPPEMIVAADLESRRTVVIVYSVRDGRIVPILYTVGSRLAVEAVGTDLVTRGAADDGAEQVVRYRWDGVRLTPVRDEKTYKNASPGTSGAAGAPDSRCKPDSDSPSKPDPDSSSGPGPAKTTGCAP
ncbi:hypothetical protein CG740_29540 [Streptomyces sp. CB01201]|uniref:hypothetical protein n=1 Tax=Streptomyces sp. CB01201 TaxID=2020324 RepID=UPI000C26DD48|nr:hypothetical protein [Streptomyces sp. CB01201]PJM99672.1 hypothetical protein CG740_29540 [Streptomyces sp. CB01201]